MISRRLRCLSHPLLLKCVKSVTQLMLSRSPKNTSLGFPCGINDHFTYFGGCRRSIGTGGGESDSVELHRLAQIVQSTPEDVCTPYILNKLISSSAKSADLNAGSQLHSASVIKQGFISNVFICSSLIDLYGKSHAIKSAQKLFDEMPIKNSVTWNSLISGYLQVGSPETALELFLEMIRGGTLPTPFSVSSVLVGCSLLRQSSLGAQIHGLCLKCMYTSNIIVTTTLIDTYAKCLKMDECIRVFNDMVDRNVMTWTTLITGYSLNNLPCEALVLFVEMRRSGFKPNYMTYNGVLSSFSGDDHLVHCRQIHSQIVKVGLESNAHLQVTLVTVYSECGCSLEDFRRACLEITHWEDQISWNAVIAGFSNLECSTDAIKCFIDMRLEGITIDFFTLTSVLKSIGIVSLIKVGRQTHSLVFKTGNSFNVHVQNGLVSMYARCGYLIDAKKVFASMSSNRDIISWNSLMSGCAHHGYGCEVIELFEQMWVSGIQPNRTTFLSILSACSHVGLVEKGLEFFDLLRELYPPESLWMEHYASVVDLFSRAGHINEAEAFINSMPIQPGPSIYKSLLSACRIHRNMEVSVRASKRLLELYPEESSTYVLLSSSLATEACWEAAADWRSSLQERKMPRNSAYSWIHSSESRGNSVHS